MVRIMSEAIDYESIEQEAKRGQATVVQLLDQEKVLLKKLEEIGAIADQSQKFEHAAKLIVEAEALVNLSGDLAKMINTAKKRIDKVVKQAKTGVLEDVEDEGGEVETENFVLKSRKNPVRVVVDNLADVPKKYRLEPNPIPPWQEWDVDKHYVKQALTKEKVRSIDGISLEQGTRLEIKPR